VRKIDISTLEIVASANFYQTTSTALFLCCAVDGTGVYIGGKLQELQNFTMKVALDDLTNVIWSVIRSGTSSNYTISIRGLYVDGTDVYSVGLHSDGQSETTRINKINGSLIWHREAILSCAYDVIEDPSDSSFIIVCGHGGSYHELVRFVKSDGTNELSTFANVAGHLMSIVNSGSIWYSSGTKEGLSADSHCSRLTMSTKVWEYTKVMAVERHDEMKRIQTDGSFIYGVGYADYSTALPYRGTFFKLLMDGTGEWAFYHPLNHVRPYRGLVLETSTFLVGTYDNDPSISTYERYGYVERRKKETGELSS